MQLLLLATVVLAAGLVSPQAQPATQTHKHYADDGSAAQASPSGALAPRLQNLGVHTFKVSTASEQAQLFFNQGLNLAYGFNHPEAARAFREAARLDPNLAMAHWGHALVLGPNINAPMAAGDEPVALESIQRAISLKAQATERERDYIDALAARYTGAAEDRDKANRAFADAMRALSQKYPDDHDARTIYAEALMDLRPWNYWTRDGKPYEETTEALAALESVLKANPNHPGALHYWIHVWEPTDTPERAEKEADRLLPLMPGAGHVVHMPAHIFMRVGRHHDVVTSNLAAEKADEEYITLCRAQGIYPLAYYPHNTHFVWMGASASGQSAIALSAANKLASYVLGQQAALKDAPFLEIFLAVPHWTLVTFERWDEILRDTGPALRTPFTEGVWRYARARALAAQGRFDEADAEQARLAALVNGESFKADTGFSTNGGYGVLRIAVEVVAGEIAAGRKDYDRALLHLDRAIRLEDALVYQEPPDWPHPVRLILGRVLLDAGRADEAEVAYWEDLKRNPETGWALFGLQRALEAQGKMDDAALVDARFKQAWSRADFVLSR
jgi:tetratricopeptide (TPR) repeat protein